MTHTCRPECVDWVGTGRCHCASCGETFVGLSGFDLHRSGSKDRKHARGSCSNPSDRGLILNDRGHWRSAEDRDYDQQFGR